MRLRSSSSSNSGAHLRAIPEHALQLARANGFRIRARFPVRGTYQVAATALLSPTRMQHGSTRRAARNLRVDALPFSLPRLARARLSGTFVEYRGTSNVNVSSLPRSDAAQDSGLQPALRECVARAVRRYLHDVGTAPVDGLHALVLREVELPLLREVLTWYGGNQSRAAAALGINRATLRKKMQQYGLAA